MKFSVVVPCHNAAPTIGEALRGIAAQTLAPHEIIVINDASSDDSRAQIMASGVAVTLLEVEFFDSGEARNLGIERASGDWIALCDADDVWFPHHLEQAAQLLSGGTDIAYMANHCWLDANGQAPLPKGMCHRIDSGGGRTGAQWLDTLVGGFHFGHSTVVYRSDYLRRIGAFDLSCDRQEDLDLWLRALRGGTWAYGAQSAMAYRTDTPGSMSKAVVKSAYFYLRALLRNRAYFGGAAMQTLIGRSARRALSLAFVDGTRAEFRAAWRLAGPHVAPGLRVFYALAPLVQPVARAAIRFKRRWVWRHSGESKAS